MTVSAIKQINPKCPVCFGSKISTLCQSNGYEVLRCSSCACDFVWPIPNKKDLKAYYDSESYFQGNTFQINSKGSYSNYDMDTESVLSLFHNFLLTFNNVAGKKILDIGCAYGTQLALAAELGWEAWGVELSDHAREIAISRHGDKVQVVEDIGSLPRIEFDLVVIFDVLEHLPKPYEMLIQLMSQGIVGKKTQLVITTPNARSADALNDPEDWAYRHPPAHLVYFSAKSLRHLIATLGGQDISVQGIYQLESRDSRDFPDEDNSFNHAFKHYAGLMCIANGFDISITNLAALRNSHQSKVFVGEDSDSHSSSVESFIDNINYLIESRIQQLEVEITLLRKECDDKKFLVDHLEGENKNFKIENDSIRNSMSWKVTKPLRNVKILFKAIFSALNFNNKSKHSVECYQTKILNNLHDSRQRVVHVIGNFMTGGSSRLVVDLFEHLGHLYEQEVVTQFNPNPPNYIGIPIHEFKGTQSNRAFIAYLHKFHPKIIHIHYWGSVDKSWYTQMIDAANDFGCKVVENINTPVQPYIDARISRYVYVSDYVKHTFGATDSSNLTVYPGSNFRLFSRDSTLEMPDDCIGMVYRLDIDKLNENSIDVFIKVAQNRPQTKVLVVGGGPLLETYKAAVITNNVQSAFNFTGFVDYEKLPELYAQMSLFVAPVWKESFGQVSPFAMSMGIPVVGYNVGALSEIISDTSLLAPANDSDALAKIIIDLLNDKQRRERIGQQNRELAHSLFSVESMIDSYAKLYKELVESK